MAVSLSPKGLHTFANELEYPDGALQEAKNIVIDKEGVAEPRRGFVQFGSTFGDSTSRTKQLLVFKKRVFRHYENTLQFDDGFGSFTSFLGSYTEPEDGIRIKSQEANGNLYFTTSSGIKKVDAASAEQIITTSIRNAGGVKGADIEAVINYKQAGFFTQQSKVVYRIVWGYKDNNTNLILGVPSGRAEVVNRSTTTSGITKLTFTIPKEIVKDLHFYQVYRSAVITGAGFTSIDDIVVDDELQLVIEDFPTDAQLAAGEVVVDDATPEDFRAAGTPLYTNVNSGEGIGQANERPPLAKDISLFNGSTFYANTKTIHRKSVNLLSIFNFTSGSSELLISSGANTRRYKFVGVVEKSRLDTASCSLAVPAGLYGKYFKIASYDDKRIYYVWFSNGTATVDPVPDVNWIGVKVDVSGATTLTNLANIIGARVAADSNFIYDFTIQQTGTVLDFTATNVGASTDIADGNGTSFTFSTPQQGDGENPTATIPQVRLSGMLTPGQQLDDTGRSIARVVNKDPTSPVIANYISGASEIPGQLLFESKVADDNPIYFGVNDAAIAGKFNPSLPVAKTAAVATGFGSYIVTLASHGFKVGTQVVLYNSTTTPALNSLQTVTAVTTNTFTLTGSISTSGTVSVFEAKEKTDNEAKANRVYFSKYQQPEAVPLLNYVDVGSKDQAIERIVALRDSLFVFKTDAIYRLYGPSAPNFSVVLMDKSASIISPDSASVLNNKIYLLTTQGVSTVSEGNVSIISRSIEDKFSQLYSYGNTRKLTFSVASETDRAYFLWTVQTSTDTTATTCYRFNVFTNAWTEFPLAKTCAVRNPGNDKIYLGPADLNRLEIERKNFNRKDYADREYDIAIPQLAVSGNTIQLSSSSGVAVGDVIVQTQYLSITQFNRFLQKLDKDPGLTNKDYLATTQASPGDNIFNKLNELIAKLAADDTAETYTGATVNDFAAIQIKFNEVVDKLNGQVSKAFYKTFTHSVGTIQIEGLITTKLYTGNKVQTFYPTAFLEGPITHYVSIKTRITWVPQHFGNPQSLKQVNEGTFLFKFNNFTSGTISYNSDLEQNFDKIPFQSFGPGAFGSANYDATTFGGQGNKVPIRTYIPRTKQRCRFLQCRFEHNNAFEHYQLYGLSLNPREISVRGYR